MVKEIMRTFISSVKTSQFYSNPSMFLTKLPEKGRTIPIARKNVTFFQLYIHHFPKHKLNL